MAPDANLRDMGRSRSSLLAEKNNAKVIADTISAATSNSEHDTYDKMSACLKSDKEFTVANAARHEKMAREGRKKRLAKRKTERKKTRTTSRSSKESSPAIASDTTVTALPRPYLKYPEGVEITNILPASQQTASTSHNFVEYSQDYRPKVIRAFETSTTGNKYVMLDNKRWYKLKHASQDRQPNDQKHAEAVDSSIAPVIASCNDNRKLAQLARKLLAFSRSSKKDGVLEGYTDEEIKEALAKLRQLRKQMTKNPVSPEDKEDKKGIDSEDQNEGIQGGKVDGYNKIRKGRSRRKRPEELKWYEYRFVARNGLLSSWEKYDKRKGHKIRHRCTWIPLPVQWPIDEASGNGSVPGLVLTNPEGMNFSLHDPAELRLRD